MKISFLKHVLPVSSLLGLGGGAGIGGTYAVMSKKSEEELTVEKKREVNKGCNDADAQYREVLRKRGSYSWNRDNEKEKAEEGKKGCGGYHNGYYNIYDFNLKFPEVH